MHNYQHTKKTVNNTPYPRFDIRDHVRNFIGDIRKREGRILNTHHSGEVEYMKELLNNPKYTAFKSIRAFDTGIPHWNEQGVDYVSSNLGRGRGYIFYFICNGCRRRVKYLYEHNILESPLCRTCCQLSYEAPPNKTRELIRLLRKPHFPNYSSGVRYMIVKQVGITKEDVSG